ncbi:MAG: pseudouridine synthase [Lachnospiraceae bacterium]
MENKSTKRINKYLSECGICSRREADKLIAGGKVTIDGRIATSGEQVEESNDVAVNGKKIQPVPEKIVLAFNKPTGVTCTERDAHAATTIIEYLNYPVRVTYAGRLDKDSEGLMIMTNDGELISQLTRSSNQHEKEYIVKVRQPITDTFLKRMSEGIYLKDLNQKTRPCQVFKSGKYTFHIILTQGLNRQIRRMCESLSYQVMRLQRIRIMNITLEPLKTGAYREITGKELATLYQLLQEHK